MEKLILKEQKLIMKTIIILIIVAVIAFYVMSGKFLKSYGFFRNYILVEIYL